MALPQPNWLRSRKVYYVDSIRKDQHNKDQGSDLNDGRSPDTPFATIARAFAQCANDAAQDNNPHDEALI